DRLVRDRHRLEAALPAADGPAGTTDHRRAAEPVVLPPRGVQLPQGPELGAPIPVVAVAVAAARPPGRLLAKRGSDMWRRPVQRRDPAARYAGAVVGLRAGVDRAGVVRPQPARLASPCHRGGRLRRYRALGLLPDP